MSNITDTNIETLAHAAELATKVIEAVAGEAIANTIDGKVMAGKDIQRSVAAKMQAAIITAEKKR